MGREAVAVWRERFEEIVNGGEEMTEEMQDGRERFIGDRRKWFIE